MGIATIAVELGSSGATVKPATALYLVALGLALAHPDENSRLAFAVGLAGLPSLALDLLDRFGIDLGINGLDRLLVPRAAAPGPEASFHMINAFRWRSSSRALRSRSADSNLFATALGALAGSSA